jgi:hypothetical protein
MFPSALEFYDIESPPMDDICRHVLRVTTPNIDGTSSLESSNTDHAVAFEALRVMTRIMDGAWGFRMVTFLSFFSVSSSFSMSE